jgi:group I intron endonuclease
MGYIYLITNKINGKSYVGQTRQKNPKNRWRQHINDPRGILKTAFDKYGIEKFEFKTLFEVSNDELNENEKREISERKTISPNGYNLQSGGECREVHPETREKQRARWGPGHPLWNQKHTDETKEKIRIATRGENNPMYGKTHTPEVILKMSENNHMKGKTGSLAPTAKKIDAYSLDGEFLQTFDCIRDAAESIVQAETGIVNCARGRSKTCGGFIWKYNKGNPCNIDNNGSI